MAFLRTTKWKRSRVRSATLARPHAHHDLLTGLVLRVLYRLRTLSESAPLDGATLSYASPLLAVILKTGGIGLQGEDSDPAEQIILVLDIINFHSGECESHVVNGMGMLTESTQSPQPRLSSEGNDQESHCHCLEPAPACEGSNLSIDRYRCCYA